MKKIIFFFSIFLIFACEDKEDEVNPLVGQWNMTNFSGGVYLKLNKTQEIFMGETEGSIEAKTISNEILTDTYNLTEVRIDNNDDGTFIDVSEYANNYSVDYNIRDFIGSLDAYDESSLYIYSNNINGDYYGTNFDYTISTNSLKVFPDTLYRKLYINGNEVWDSTRYAVVEGSITQLTTLVEAGQDFLMDGDEFEEILGPSELTLILNDDSTGRAIESFDGDTEENEIKWQATDRSADLVGPTSLKDKWESFGWNSSEIDGNDMQEILTVLSKKPIKRIPTALILNTIKGKGVSFMEDDNNWHYRIPNKEEVELAFNELGVEL